MLLGRYADKHLMSCVCRFYAVEGEISNLALTVETWKSCNVDPLLKTVRWPIRLVDEQTKRGVIRSARVLDYCGSFQIDVVAR